MHGQETSTPVIREALPASALASATPHLRGQQGRWYVVRPVAGARNRKRAEANHD